MKKIVLFICTFYLFSYAVIAGELTAATDVTEIPYGESFVLTVSYVGDGDGNLQPDFSVLKKDFRISPNIQISSSSSSVNFSKARVNQEWKLVILPVREGKLEIPSISTGKYKTKPLSINVLPAGSEIQQKKSNQSENKSTKAKAVLSLTADNLAPYVQQEINVDVVVKDYVGIGLRSEPQFENADDWVIKSIGQPEIVGNKEGGRDVIFHYAMFPQKSGKQFLPTVSVEGYYMEYNDDMTQSMMLRGSLFQMMNADFDRVFAEQRPLYLRSKPVSVNVLQIADGYGNSWWLPAEALSFEASWLKKDDLKVGDAITREITLVAYGVSDTQLPELNMPENSDFKIYPEKPQLDASISQGKILSRAVYHVVYIPQKSGKLEIPAINMPWFNVNTKKIENAVIPQEILNVQKNERFHEIMEEPIVNEKTNQYEKFEDDNSRNQKDFDLKFMVMITLLSFIFGMIVCYLVFFIKNNKMHNEFKVKHNILIKEDIKNHDYKSLRDDLIAWAETYMPNEKVNNLNELAVQISDNDFTGQMQILNRILYSNSDEVCDADKIIKPLNAKLKQIKKKKRKSSALPELYR